MPKRQIATTIRIGKRDKRILESLLTCVPVMSFNQIAEYFLQSDEANTRRALERLIKLDLIEEISCASRVSPRLDGPIVNWNPGEIAPDPYRIANLLQSRWERLRLVRRVHYTIGARMRNLFGIPHPPIRPLQVSHDFGVAEVYLLYCARLLKPTQRWIGDIAYRNAQSPEISRLISTGSQKPDALVVENSGLIVKAIEFGGVYNAKRIIKFHQWCQRKEVSYEIW